jgi:hypothetical protein
MIDSGSWKTYIKKSTADKLKLYIIPKQSTVPLADNNQTAKIVGEVVINIEINGQIHRGITAEVIKNLCTDIIIGRDRLQKHRRVIFNFNGPSDDLVIGAVPHSDEHPDEHSDPSQTVVDNSNKTNKQSSNNPSVKLPNNVPSQSKSSLPPNFGTVNISPPPLFTNLSKNIKPIATKSRRQSMANLNFIKQEIDKLHASGITSITVESTSVRYER